MMELYWTPEAVKDRETIYDHIESRSPVAALALDELFEEKAGRLTYHPHMARAAGVPGTRKLVTHHNDILVYDVAGKVVRILRVLHAARQGPQAQA